MPAIMLRTFCRLVLVSQNELCKAEDRHRKLLQLPRPPSTFELAYTQLRTRDRALADLKLRMGFTLSIGYTSQHIPTTGTLHAPAWATDNADSHRA